MATDIPVRGDRFYDRYATPSVGELLVSCALPPKLIRRRRRVAAT